VAAVQSVLLQVNNRLAMSCSEDNVYRGYPINLFEELTRLDQSVALSFLHGQVLSQYGTGSLPVDTISLEINSSAICAVSRYT
jgi:hypothetical protein